MYYPVYNREVLNIPWSRFGRYAFCYPRAVEIMDAVTHQSVVPDVRKLITHRFKGLDSIPEAYETASKTKDANSQLVIKTVANL